MAEDILVIPPIRQSLEDITSAKANDIDQPRTEKSWYLYWQRTGDQVNANTDKLGKLITYGPHATRPPADSMPKGSLYMETDRGGVIYQNIGTAWKYRAGTMFGTLTPDQRPTDLGVNDPGFDFRGTDVARQFLWSQTEWIETTEAQYGNHADRPNPNTIVQGALYCESDRGGVIYQNIGTGWKYRAGTMFGTLSPDQRPTDLGVNDPGFDFRATDIARQFLWSQTEWVEATEVQYGIHSARPVPASIVEGSLYVESDRGAIYQNQAGVWKYLAGTMYGTLSPDLRPTDLGVDDGGFQFRGTDQQREFIWSQTVWVEVTPLVDPTTTKGDLLVRGTSAPPTRLGVGANGTVLTADSAQPLGVRWGTAAGGSQWTDVTGGIAYSGGKVGVATTTLNSTLDVVVPSLAPGSTYGVRFATGVPLSGSDTLGFGVSAGAYSWIQATTPGVAFRNLLLQPVGGFVGIGTPAAVSYQLTLQNDSAGKPGTSTWSVISDVRAKQNIENVTDDSLAILERLQFVRFEYNGLGGSPKDYKAIGLSAQDLREHLSEAVRSTRGKLAEDDTEETELLAIDYHHILIHTARAVQQLSEEIKALKQKP